jgi:hypothetical protein
MPIQVTCPNCLKRFQVSDKFAGKTGPCPNCKKPLRVPDASEEVVIHAPEPEAPKDSKGKSIVAPILREEVDFTRRGLILTAGAVLAGILVAVGFRFYGGAPWWAQVLGAVLLAPPLVWVGYTFVREQELEPYRGEELRNRVLILSGIFAALWLIYVFIPPYLFDLDSASEMDFMTAGITFVVMLGLGTVASIATFELETIGGLAHAGLYLIGTALLAIIAGVTLAGASVPLPGAS